VGTHYFSKKERGKSDYVPFIFLVEYDRIVAGTNGSHVENKTEKHAPSLILTQLLTKTGTSAVCLLQVLHIGLFASSASKLLLAIYEIQRVIQ
jgi:hypothetical protein